MQFKQVGTRKEGRVLNQTFALYFFMFVILYKFISNRNSVTMNYFSKMTEFSMLLK